MSLILSDVTTGKLTKNTETRDEDEDDVDDDNLSTNSNPPALALLPTSSLRRK